VEGVRRVRLAVVGRDIAGEAGEWVALWEILGGVKEVEVVVRADGVFRDETAWEEGEWLGLINGDAQ
jgi:hypothetical protein